MARRDEEKKRRRQKRLDKRQSRERASRELHDVLTTLQRQASVPEPTRWPGGCDPSLDRPDRVKFDLATFATRKPPGRLKCNQLEKGIRNGLMGDLPNLEHWAWEEFLWHGLPGDPWHPVDAFLEQAGDRFLPPAREQLRRWKEARLGIFEIGDVADDTVALREWDAIGRHELGPWVRAITLNIGGVNLFHDARGRLLLTYLAPWRPEQDLYCGMGYSRTAEKGHEFLVLPYLDLRYPDLVSRPLPWNVSRSAEAQYERQWRQREWHGWLHEQLQFPFLAWVPQPPRRLPQLKQVEGLVPSKPEHARLFGVYFQVNLDNKEVLAAGGTTVMPLDVTSANRLALAEYHAFRQRAGPPPGTPRDGPAYLNLR